MTLYAYSAYNANGELVEGTIDAISIQAAYDALQQMQLEAKELHEEPTPVEPSPLPQPEKPKEPVIDWEEAKKQVVLQRLEEEIEGETKEPSDTANEAPLSELGSPARAYYPILDTLRLYAGWLLAWYCLVYALGMYQHTRNLPFRIPYVEGLLLSPLVLSFAFATFLFLLFTGIQRGKGKLSGIILAIVGVGVFVLYRMNTA